MAGEVQEIFEDVDRTPSRGEDAAAALFPRYVPPRPPWRVTNVWDMPIVMWLSKQKGQKRTNRFGLVSGEHSC